MISAKEIREMMGANVDIIHVCPNALSVEKASAVVGTLIQQALVEDRLRRGNERLLDVAARLAPSYLYAGHPAGSAERCVAAAKKLIEEVSRGIS